MMSDRAIRGALVIVLLRSLMYVLMLAAPALTFAQAYPARPVRLIITYPPGGSTDFVGRLVGQRLSELIGQPIVIDNRGGAAGSIGTAMVAQAAPDGYTLLLGTLSTLLVNPLLNDKVPYDAFRDFAPISRTNINPQILAAHPGLAANNVKELLVLARARPGQLNIASPGSGSVNHVGAEMLNHLAGIKLVHVPYRGGGPAAVDLIAGNVQLQMTSIPSVLPHAKAGRMKMLGVGSPKRASIIPDVPTIAESGVPGYDDTLWFGLFAPRNTPAHIVTRLSTETGKALASKDLRERMLSQGAEPAASTPQALSTLMRDDHARWAKIIKAANIKLE